LIRHLETDVLPRYLRQQRWFAAKNEQIDAAVLRDRCGWNTGRGAWLLTTVDARFESGGEQTYFLPLAIALGAERAGPAAPAARSTSSRRAPWTRSRRTISIRRRCVGRRRKGRTRRSSSVTGCS